MNYYKTVLLGQTAVGKTSFVTRLVRGNFRDFMEPTIGAAYSTYKMDINGKIYGFEIWDTAGQERYKALAPMYYKKSNIAIIVYSITCSDSFKVALNWVKEIISQNDTKTIIVLIGNKSDLDHNRKITYEDAYNSAMNISSDILFYESSVKDNRNIADIFQKIVTLLPNTSPEGSEILLNTTSDTPRINLIYNEKNRNTCC